MTEGRYLVAIVAVAMSQRLYPSICLSSSYVRLLLFGKVMFPSPGCLTPHTKPRAHALTQKSYVANQNNICIKPPQEDIANGFFSSRSGRYCADGGCRPKFHYRIA
jgi:hypothetical protein